MHCHVVIPAAGKGERFSWEIPKQFCRINGWPIISHTVEKFIRESCVDNIVVVAPECEEGRTRVMGALLPLKAKKNKIFIATGARTRHRSIYRGLQHLKMVTETTGKWEDEIVIIHDGVRPFVKPSDIRSVVAATAKYKAAGIIKPMVSTVLSVDQDDMLENSLDRSKHYASEMPQGFHLGLILNAYEKCTEYELDHGTECLQLALKYGGVTPKLIHGDPNNLWKVTYNHEILAAKALLTSSRGILFVIPDEESIDSGLCLSEPGIPICKASELGGHLNTTTIGVMYLMPETQAILQHIDIILKPFRTIRDEYPEAFDCAVIFFVSIKEQSSPCEEIRGRFQDIAEQAQAYGLLLHIVAAKVSDISKSRAFKNTMDLLQNHNRMLNGQTLYFND